MMSDLMMPTVGIVPGVNGKPHFDDRELYGKTTEEDRRAIRDYLTRIRYSRPDAEDVTPLERHAVIKADDWGRIAYAYAGGWYDATKRTIPADKAQKMLDGMWYFAEEATWAEFQFQMGSGSRYGYGGAWEHYLTAKGLTD